MSPPGKHTGARTGDGPAHHPAHHYAEGPEALIVSIAAKGDREAFDELVRRRQGWMRNLLRRCCGDEALADDLAQQAFLHAWRKLRQLKEPAKFGGWLRQIAVTTFLQQRRGRDVLGDAGEIPDSTPARPDRPGLAMDLEKALATLSGDSRLCIVLSYRERMSHGEISRATGIPLGTVKSLISRGSARLREILSDYGDST